VEGGMIVDKGCYKSQGSANVCKPKYYSCPSDYSECFVNFAYWSSIQPHTPPEPSPPPPPSVPMTPPGITAPPPYGCVDSSTKCTTKAQKGKCWKNKVQKKCQCTCPGTTWG